MRAALLSVVVVVLVACAPSAAQLRLQSIQQARSSAQSVPGARQAAAYAEAVHGAYIAGDYKAKPQQLTFDANDAIAVLDRAVETGTDAPTLVAWRALLLSDLGRYEESNDEFLRSFGMAPNLLAGRNLVLIYGAANMPDKVGEICNTTALQVVLTDDARMDLIDMCKTNMNATTDEAAIAWMSPKLRSWYDEESTRRHQARVEAQQRAEERQAYEQRVVRQTEKCAAGCKERGLECQNECYGDAKCENRCVEINRSCLDGCEASAYEKLGY